MKRLISRSFPLSVSLCLLALAFPLSALAQSKVAPKNEKKPQSDKTLSSKGAPVITVAPKSTSTTNASFLSPLEQEIINEMNLARTEPQKYAGFIVAFKNNYNGNKLTYPGATQAIITVEGIPAVEEAINYLKAAKPLPAMTITMGPYLAAKDHARDLAQKGISGHRGSDGSTPNARLERYGRWEGVVGENIVYEVRTAREIVIGLIIDDGTQNRGHRRNIFDPNHRITGVSISEPSTNGAKCVITYVGGYMDNARTPK